jgi:hypothetical protein
VPQEDLYVEQGETGSQSVARVLMPEHVRMQPDAHTTAEGRYLSVQVSPGDGQIAG